MTMPANTDIIKALELCITQKGADSTCTQCYYHQFGSACKTRRDSDAADLLNYYKTEIERLKTENEFHRKTIAENAQIEIEVLNEAVMEAKSEARKEFADRLKDIYAAYDGLHQAIDDLIKEMEAK